MFSSYFGGGTPTATNDDESKPLIVITGVTGFIGSQILNHCLKNFADQYRFRGTTRSPNDFDKMGPLYNFFGGEDALL